MQKAPTRYRLTIAAKITQREKLEFRTQIYNENEAGVVSTNRTPKTLPTNGSVGVEIGVTLTQRSWRRGKTDPSGHFVHRGNRSGKSHSFCSFAACYQTPGRREPGQENPIIGTGSIISASHSPSAARAGAAAACRNASPCGPPRLMIQTADRDAAIAPAHRAPPPSSAC